MPPLFWLLALLLVASASAVSCPACPNGPGTCTQVCLSDTQTFQTLTVTGNENVGGNLGVTGTLSGQVATPTPRSLISKLDDIVSVMDYGAVGNGVADDTAAIQAAVTASRLVYMPCGVYLISSAIVVSSFGQSLRGAGICSQLKPNGNFSAISVNAWGSTLTSFSIQCGSVSAYSASALLYNGTAIASSARTYDAASVLDGVTVVAAGSTGVGVDLFCPDGSTSSSCRVIWVQSNNLRIIKFATSLRLNSGGGSGYVNGNSFVDLTIDASGIGIYINGTGNTFSNVELQTMGSPSNLVYIGGGPSGYNFISGMAWDWTNGSLPAVYFGPLTFGNSVYLTGITAYYGVQNDAGTSAFNTYYKSANIFDSLVTQQITATVSTLTLSASSTVATGSFKVGSGSANSLTLSGSSASSPVLLTASGSDTNIDVQVVCKGTGALHSNNLQIDQVGTFSNGIKIGVAGASGYIYPQGGQQIHYTGTIVNDGSHYVSGDLHTSSRLFIDFGNPPASSSAAGSAGQFGWDGSNLYLCVATNTWKRVALTTF